MNESIIIKVTLGAVFLGVTLLFAGKIIMLFIAYGKVKIFTGEFLVDLKQWLWEAVWNGGGK